MHRIWTADIGGTNSRFGHFQADGRALRKVETRWLRTGDHDSFEHLLDALPENGFSLSLPEADMAVIAVAGPVEGGLRSDPPLIPWNIDLSHPTIRARFGHVLLINDFVAHAYSCLSPAAASAERILRGTPAEDGTVAVIGGGTGLGMAALLREGERAVPLPSEGGHAAFPFESHEESFRRFLERTLEARPITGNHVISGRGLSALHAFLTGERLTPPELAQRLTAQSETLARGARLYGRACRNFALTVLAQGGLYIAGGLAARLPDLVRHEHFRKEFYASPTMEALLRKIPVFRITNEESGLWGAATAGVQALAR